VSFELAPWCGINKDNIWKHWIPKGVKEADMTPLKLQLGNVGQTYTVGNYGPYHEKDAWLVNERNEKQ
jgi:hypothetical protein